MGTTRKILDQVKENGPNILLYSSVLYLANAVKNAAVDIKNTMPDLANDMRHNTTVGAMLAAGGGWLSGALNHISAYNRIDNFVTVNGNVVRSFRSKVSAGFAAASVTTGVLAARNSAVSGQEMTTVGLAVASGISFHISGLFAVKEAEAAEAKLLDKKKLPENRERLMEGAPGEGQQPSAPQMGMGSSAV